ncbi:MAG: hypothetical protein U9N73_03720 [Candidatus Auribacterota bacterium]|nr:hypothetical protein [Candidatus Auribacterota bacterium]
MSKICYLCGKLIKSKSTADHVPPQQIFAPGVRKKHNLDNLTTLPTHKNCNENYCLDEDYFVWSLAPIASMRPTAKAVVRHHTVKFRSGQCVGLGRKIIEQFTEKPGGIYLPGDLVAMSVEGNRINRVAGKIIRGLFWIENESFLPEETPYLLELIEPENHGRCKHPEYWEPVKAQVSKGTYPGVFDYKYLYAKAGELQLHVWGMLFWDQIMIFIAHHHPKLRTNIEP